MPEELIDGRQRRITYLRLSVTDRCNMECIYCKPGHMDHARREEMLSFEEIARLAGILASLGVSKLRLTGGEPLLRSKLWKLVRMLSGTDGIADISMTTNGQLLSLCAADLRNAGLDRINVSLDTLSPATFTRLSGGGLIEGVLAGLESAREVGFSSIKLNSVPIRGINDHETVDIVGYARERGFIPRFIELMPVGIGLALGPASMVPADEILRSLERDYVVEPMCEGLPAGNGPARYMRLRERRAGSRWSPVGVIPAMTERFCHQCNRIRITSTGEIRACLGWDSQVSLRDLIRKGADDETILDTIRNAVLDKKEGHSFSDAKPNGLMTSIGG